MRLQNGFEVEWCSSIPVNEETGERELDEAVYEYRDFETVDSARTYALEVLPKDCFGSVRVTRFEMALVEPGYKAMTREYIGEPEYID